LCGESFSDEYAGIRSNDRHLFSLTAELRCALSRHQCIIYHINLIFFNPSFASVRIGGESRLYLADECYRRLGEELDVIRAKYWARLRGETQEAIAAALGEK
jgi:hypothetical protein